MYCVVVLRYVPPKTDTSIPYIVVNQALRTVGRKVNTRGDAFDSVTRPVGVGEPTRAPGGTFGGGPRQTLREEPVGKVSLIWRIAMTDVPPRERTRASCVLARI